VTAKGHRGIARGEVRQGDGVARIVEEPGIAMRRGLVRPGMIQTDHRIRRDLRNDRSGWPVEQQRADRIRLRSNMRTARSAQLAAEVGFVFQFYSP
jgi:hypothetical protein